MCTGYDAISYNAGVQTNFLVFSTVNVIVWKMINDDGEFNAFHYISELYGQ